MVRIKASEGTILDRGEEKIMAEPENCWQNGLDDSDGTVAQLTKDAADSLRDEVFKTGGAARDKVNRDLRKDDLDIANVGHYLLSALDQHGKSIDTDGDSYISPAEVKAAMAGSNGGDKERLLAVLSLFDSGVDANSLRKGLEQISVAETGHRIAHDMLSSFELLDTDENGFLDKNELEKGLRNKKLAADQRQSAFYLSQRLHQVQLMSDDEFLSEGKGASKEDLKRCGEMMAPEEHRNLIGILRTAIKR